MALSAVIYRLNLFQVFLLVCFSWPCSAVIAAVDPVARLQESFTADQAQRKKIYSEVVSLVDGSGESDSTFDRKWLLAGAVALKQMAMDAEDEFLEDMKSSAPDFRKLAWSNPEFVKHYHRAAERFEKLYADFPFIEPYGACASSVDRYWQDGSAMLGAAVSFKEKYPLSRFWKRLALLAGCRLLLEKKYEPAGKAFQALWNEDPSCPQAVTAYSLVDALERDKATGSLKLTAANRLAWGRALGLSGTSVLDRLIELHPQSDEAESAYYQIFSNINRGFASRSLSNNYRQAERFDKYFNRFAREFPGSGYLEKALELRADFHYRCGKKSQSIARKNDHTWRRSKRSLNRRASKKYYSIAGEHFSRVAALDSMAASSFPGSRCFFQVGISNVKSMIELDRFDQAETRLEALLAEGPDSLSVNSILWYSGLIRYLKEDFPAAVDYLGRLEKANHRDAAIWSRGMLFLGKSYLALSDTLAVGRVFGALSRAYPYTYHGIRARLLKSELYPEVALLRWSDFSVENLSRFPESYTRKGERFQQEAGNWQSLGFFAEAAYIYANALRQEPQDLLLRYRYHENFLLAGWYHRVLRGFRGAFREFLHKGGIGLPDNFWQLAYLNPEPYRKIIARQSASFNVPQSLITAVIRQESNFNSQARSHAGARGLMQLLPSLARRLSRGMGLGKVTNQRLYDPKVNLALGVKFLSGNLDKYKGNIALAASCYNADPRNLPVWLERIDLIRRNERFDLDLFIELIPLEETHDYNIQILTNFWRYQEVYGKTRDFFCWKLGSF